MARINRSVLREMMPKFHDFLGGEGQDWKAERQQKDAFFAEHFSADAIERLDEGTLRALIYILWSFNGWTNKDFLVEQMLTSGIPAIRAAFKRLLFSDEPIAARFDHVRNSVRMMGAASISEILSHNKADAYPIWNRRSRRGLVILGVSESALPRSSQISGTQYEAFCELAREVQSEVSDEYPEFDSLLVLDLLLAFLSFQDVGPRRQEVEIRDFEHDAVIDQVLELGDGLGFEVQKEFSVARGCRVDAIWRTRVANLGTIAYAFEVHRRGSRDSAILNLQRVRSDPSIQKVVIVSTTDELEQFRAEIATLDERFRTSVGYFDVQDLQRALDHLLELKEVLNGLGLMSRGAAVA